MDLIFLLNEGDRQAFLRQLLSLGCTYICLWSYLPQPSNCFISMDGFYHEENQASSSLGSLAQRLFIDYRQSFIPFDDNGYVPGLAFKTRSPFMELNISDLQSLASNTVQLQFYEEARIKSAIFMGCTAGEIELGMSTDPQVDLRIEMRNLFPEDFSRQTAAARELPQPSDQNRPSSSSSSLRSLSIDSPEYPPLRFTNIAIPTTSFNTISESPKESTTAAATATATATSSSPQMYQQQAIQVMSQIRNTQFPTIESEDAAMTMTKAIFSIFSSPSSSSSSSQQSQAQQNVPAPAPIISRSSAFKSYQSALAPSSSTQMPARVRRQNTLNRAVTFFRRLNLIRTHEQIQGRRPTTTQLHHMISERKRREKLNVSFQALRSLLPPGTKKDKASVLSTAKDFLNSLKAQVADLNQKKQILEAQILPSKDLASSQEMEDGSSNLNERVHVQVTSIAESTSEARIVDLQVNVRGECSLMDLVIRVLEFLKQVSNVSLTSVQANTRMVQSTVVNHARLRLKIEGSEWDESAFQEAVKRVVEDLAL
uniref:Transcription factor bHLH65 n=1 Tax=Nothapodytes nimmoniana TaxID=159386 RepID=A0A9E8Z855_NOTNI|nr:transcription factor bHLH65 [Nothapodytes nimmoniana]